jgi:hypothetical protein
MSWWIRIRRHARRTLWGERGAALVELALVLPLLLLLVFGMVDVGKAVNYWNDETHLANEAARYAAVNNSGDVSWSTEADKTNPAHKLNTWLKTQADSGELRTGGGSIAGNGITVCIWFPNGSSHHDVGDPVQVKLTATYTWLGYLVNGPLAPFKNKTNQTLSASATMRLEQAYKADGTDAYTTGTTGITNGTGTC